jgi:hypothetical protein
MESNIYDLKSFKDYFFMQIPERLNWDRVHLLVSNWNTWENV